MKSDPHVSSCFWGRNMTEILKSEQLYSPMTKRVQGSIPLPCPLGVSQACEPLAETPIFHTLAESNWETEYLVDKFSSKQLKNLVFKIRILTNYHIERHTSSSCLQQNIYLVKRQSLPRVAGHHHWYGLRCCKLSPQSPCLVERWAWVPVRIGEKMTDMKTQLWAPGWAGIKLISAPYMNG